LLVVGGGPIGLEMGQALRRLGSAVTVVYRNERILDKDAPEASQILLDRMQAEGITFYPQSKVLFFPTTDVAVVEGPDKKRREVSFDAVLVAIGRRVHLEGLHPERAGIETQGRQDRGGRIPAHHQQAGVRDRRRLGHAVLFARGRIAGFEYGQQLFFARQTQD
jgi:pyruvate/2-oxoglutarate dehydrogenase complex dihydrolipoamide dehydrogenase (E3) component